MRIAWVTYDFGEYSLRQAAALTEEHEVLLVIPKDQLDGFEHLQPVEDAASRWQILAFDKPRLRQPLRQLRSIRQILKRIDAFQPDVVHFQQGHLWFNGALPFLRRRGYPLVITIHDPRHHAGDAVSSKTPQWVIDFGFRHADQVIVHGQNLVPEVVRELGIPERHIHVIPHVAMGGRPEVSSTMDEEEPLILFFGRIWDYKGLDYLIRAQPRISESLPSVRIMIAGQGDDFGKYEQMMVDRNKFVVDNHWITDEKRAEYFRRAALVVLPYTEATQSGVVPVASTFRKPVVATAVGALPDCIDDGVTGLLVPPRDEVALAAAIVELMQDPTRRRAMGNAAFEKLERESSAEVVARQTAEVYRRAAGTPPVVRREELAQALNTVR